MTRIKGQLTTADYLPIAEYNRLVRGLEKDGEYLWETYCWLSFCTACRASDVRTLRWKDILGKSTMTRIEQKTKKNRLIKFNRDVQEKNRFLYEMLGQPAPEQYIFLSPRTGKPYSLEYINNTVPLFAKTKTAKTGTDIYVKKDELELKTGATTLKDLLEKAEIRFSTGSISLSPVSGKTITVVNNTPWLMALVNGEFRGMYPLTGDGVGATAEKIQIHQGDAVKIVRCAYGIGTYTYSGGSGETLGDYTNYVHTSDLRVLGSSLGEIRIDAISENTKVGEKVNLKASVTGLYQDKQGKAMSSEGLALYISEPYESEQQSTDSLKLTTARTDQNGETSYIFREAGDYIIALFDTNEDTLYQESYNEMVVAGDYHGL